ncbi:MAG: PEP-CTERM sorting domain-containing protein, partial [Tepidisphaeraceae bacterium]
VPPRKGTAFLSAFNDTPEWTEFFEDFQETYTFWNDLGESDALPYFEIVSDLPLEEPSVNVNGFDLPLAGSDEMDVLDDGSEMRYDYRFSISLAAFTSIVAGNNSLEIDYLAGGSANGDLDFMMAGFTLGEAANGLSVPEPVGGIGLLFSSIGAGLRRRQRSLRGNDRSCSAA